MGDLFTVIGSGVYDGDRDLFLPDIDPEDAVGWPESDYQREIDQWEVEEDFDAYRAAEEAARWDLLNTEE